MQFVADIHIHSHFSRATSKELNFEQLTKWAQLKGVQIVGTGDVTHPGWLQEMKEKNHPKYKECKKIFDNLDAAGDEPEDTVAEEEGSDDEEDIVEEILDDLDKALKDKDVKECQELLEELLEEVGAEDEDYIDYKEKVEALSKPESKRSSRRNRK